MGRGTSHQNPAGIGGRRENDAGADLEAIAERAQQLLPRYGGFVSGAVNQAFLLAGYAASAEEQRAVEALVEAQPDPSRLCRVFVDGVEADPRHSDGSLEDVLREVVSAHPEADWIVVVNAHVAGDRVAYDRKQNKYLL